MNLKPLLAGATALLFSALAHSATANSCSWTASQFSTNGTGGPMTVRYACQAGGSTYAVKTIVVYATSQPSCSLTLSNGWTNAGSCFTPKILPPNATNTCAGSRPSGHVYQLVNLADHRSVSAALGAAVNICHSCTAAVRSTGVQSQGEAYCK